MAAYILLIRADKPPHVPSTLVPCDSCGKNCWCSINGDPRPEARAATADGVLIVMCDYCALEEMNGREAAPEG